LTPQRTSRVATANRHSLLFPAERRQLPYGRWWNIAARTVHIAATGILLGGHVFDAPPNALLPALSVAIVSGAALIAIEMYPSAHWAHQVCALGVYLKLILLCAVPFAWAYRVPILLLVVAIASVGAHMPRKFRHYSVVYRRVMAE
jgi:hypothetical protein